MLFTPRLLKLPISRSFFLFGARNTGKSTLLRHLTLCIEIKSSDNVLENKLTSFINIIKDLENCEAICISQAVRAKKIWNVIVLPWKDALRKYFTK